jgi:uncharacterized protein (TIGR03435 family)
MNSIQRSIFCVTLAGTAWSQISTPSFEVATIKLSSPTDDVGQMIRDPRLVAIAHATPQNLIAQAFRIKDFQISGPSWLDSEHFDIMARLPDGATQDQFPAMLQTLLKDRFALVFHKEPRTMSSYVLLPTKGAAKLKAIKAEIGNIHTSKGAMRRRVSGNVTMPYFAGLLSNMVDRPVVDMTELTGVFDVDLEWSADDTTGSEPGSPPSLSAALGETLGLRLESRKTAVDLFVIDHMDRLPTQN